MDKITQYISDNFSELKNKTCFVACSGGIDSMTLLHSISSFCNNTIALHVNYKLRGKDSDNDEKHVEVFCNSNKIQVKSKTIDLSEYAKNTPTSIQENARNIRYNCFNE